MILLVQLLLQLLVVLSVGLASPPEGPHRQRHASKQTQGAHSSETPPELSEHDISYIIPIKTLCKNENTLAIPISSLTFRLS